MTNGPGAGFISSFEVAPNGDYCVLVNNHFFRRIGMQWTNVPLPHSDYQNEITFGSDGSPILLPDTGILRINPDGTTTMFNTSRVSTLRSDRHGNLVAVINQQSILRSSDDGVTWDTINPPPHKTINVAMYDGDLGRFFVATDSCVYSSTDNGASWPFTSLNQGYVSNFAIGFNGKLWALYTSNGLHLLNSLYFSIDSGKTWRQVRDGKTYTSADYNAYSLLAVRNDNIALVAEGSGACYISDSVIPIGQFLPNSTAFGGGLNVTLDSSGNWYVYYDLVYNRSDVGYGRAVKSSMGPSSNWQPFSDIPGSSIDWNSELYVPTIPPLLISLPYGLLAWTNDYDTLDHAYFSSDGGDHWIPLQPFTDTSTPNAIASVQLKGSRYLGISNTGTSVISENNGQTWNFVDQFGKSPPQAIVIHEDTIYYQYSTNTSTMLDTILRSTDAGSTWELPYLDMTHLNSLEVDSLGNLFATHGDAIERYSDWGRTQIPNGTHTFYYNWSFTASKDLLLATDINDWTYVSTDDGTTWRGVLLQGGIPLQTSQCYLLTPQDDILYGSGSHIMCIQHSTHNLLDISTGLGNDFVSWLAQDPSGTIYAGTIGSGVWRLSGSFVNLRVTNTPVPQVDIYPNPCDRELRLEIPDGETLQIEIYNLFGECVYHSTLENSATVDCSHLPPSIYFASINGFSTHYQSSFIVAH